MHMEFEKVGFKVRKRGKCPICGKQATRVQEFFQTISPWNKKSREQIMKENRLEQDAWFKDPTIHIKCELKTSYEG
jgi:hypothetical protein